MIIAVEVDPMTYAGAIVFVLGGLGAMIIQVMNAYYAAKDRAEAKTSRAAIMQTSAVSAKAALVAAEKTEDAHAKLDSIKSTAEEAAKNVNGNLEAVHSELTKALELNQTLLSTVKSLTESVQAQRTRTRATDSETLKVDIVSLPPEVLPQDKKK